MGISPSPFIELAGSKGIIIVDNKIHGAEASASGNYGISADASSIDVLIQGNAITGCGDDGITETRDTGSLSAARTTWSSGTGSVTTTATGSSSTTGTGLTSTSTTSCAGTSGAPSAAAWRTPTPAGMSSSARGESS
jgi:hypothetical protein